eukprot:TRINITY_DN4592_c0_g1_i1.p1 TRINITY_DN4592_c0_g1~~TRINITY_DN4592_c0_g1_i1.p1  ORF type:complete len:302 (-),score=41.18 TRINITY_DN4592_c0_g1_i1:218-1123(-)
MEKKKRKKVAQENGFCYQDEIRQMMYTFGDAKHTDSDAAHLMEVSVRELVAELVIKAHDLAQSRGGKLTTEDLIFQTRHQIPRVCRLQEFLLWKDVRKKLKDAEDDNGPDLAAKKPKQTNTRLSWQLLSSFSQFLEPDEEMELSITDSSESQKPHRKLADAMTRNMSREQYLEFSECRQASFTYKRAKRFREWLESALPETVKIGDELIDIVGCIAWECVGLITRTALQVMRDMNARYEAQLTSANTPLPLDSTEVLFSTFPISSVHLREALRRLKTRGQTAVGFASTSVRVHDTIPFLFM